MSKINPSIEQLQFLNSNSKNILVSASAGAGKTTTMILKIIDLIVNKKINIKDILIVTFTNSASNEMRQKLYNELIKVLDDDQVDKQFILEQIEELNNCEIGTVHSICKKIISKYFYEINIDPTFNLVNENEIDFLYNNAFKNVVEDLTIKKDEKFLALYELYDTKRNTNNLNQIVKNINNFLNTKIDRLQWQNFVLDKIYNEDINSNICMIDLINYYKNIFKNFIPIFDKMKAISEDFKFDKFTKAIDNRIVLIDEFIKCENFKNVHMYFATNELLNKPSVTKNMSIDLISFNDEFAQYFEDFKKEYNKLKVFFDNDEHYYNQQLVSIKNNVEYLFEFERLVNEYYSQMKINRNLLDFNDLEKFTIELLRNDKINKELKDKYKFVFYDEYQDVNEVQEYIISSLGENCNYYIIGDVKQSIYSFRQATPEIFLNKLANQNIEKIYLNVNYRSTNSILQFANNIFDYLITNQTIGIDYANNSRFPEKQNENDDNVNIIISNNEENEHLEIANIITNIIKDDKSNYNDIAILVRDKGDYVKNLYDRLCQFHIPCNVNFRHNLFDTVEIKEILCLLKLINNYKDDISLCTVLSSFMCNLDNDDLIAISKKDMTFYDAILNYDIKDKIKNAIDKLFENIKCYKQYLYRHTLKELVLKIYEDFDVLNYFITLPNGTIRKENLYEFLNICDNEIFEYNLAKFLDYIDFANDKEKEQTINYLNNAVTITTIHKSKGLEYKYVIFAGIGRRFNLNKNTNDIILTDKYGVGLKSLDVENKILNNTVMMELAKISNRKKQFDEEIRLMYVAVTRAKTGLYLVGSCNFDEFAKTNGNIYNCKNYLSLIFNCLCDLDKQFFINKKCEFVIFDKTSGKCNVALHNEEYYANTDKPTKDSIIFEKVAISNKLIDNCKEYFEINDKWEEDNKIAIKNSVTSILKESDYEHIAYTPQELTLKENDDLSIDVLERGTIYHKVMEFVDFDKDFDLSKIKDMAKDYFGKDLSAVVNFTFIKNAYMRIKELKQKNSNIFKEMQFIMRDKHSNLINNSINQNYILVQGVIDLIIENPDGVILIDYKTNKTNNKELLNKMYATQLNLYARAYELKFNKKVDKKYLYLFEYNELIEIN